MNYDCIFWDWNGTLLDDTDYCIKTVNKSIEKRGLPFLDKKRYYEIFTLRYIKKLNQSQIAQEMKISQVELSKRFVELIKLTRENI